MKVVEAAAKQAATASPGSPMPRNSVTVPRQPSRQSMKPIRKAAAQTERQNTTAVDVDFDYMRDGRLFSEYRIRDAMAG